MLEINEIEVEELGYILETEARSYSGRAMYGKECFAIVTDDSAWQIAVRAARYLGEEQDDMEDTSALEYILDHEPRTDSMGLGTVYYWPGLEVVQGD